MDGVPLLRPLPLVRRLLSEESSLDKIPSSSTFGQSYYESIVELSSRLTRMAAASTVMRSTLLCFLSMFVVAVGQAESADFYPIKWRNCKSRFEILSVETTNCANINERCVYYRESEPQIRIGFKPNRRVEELKTSVWAHLGDAQGALTKFHMENDRSCEGNNITCPLEPGRVYYYSQAVKILPEYPTIDVQVNWLLTDVNVERNAEGLPAGRDVCIKFLATVKEVPEN